jgi:hypothetical protein
VKAEQQLRWVEPGPLRWVELGPWVGGAQVLRAQALRGMVLPCYALRARGMNAPL